MTTNLRAAGVWISVASFLAIFLAHAVALAAEKKQATPPAPIPAQILAAKKILITNAGWDDYGLFGLSATRAYDQFYAALKSAGRYELVSNVADADLIFQIQFSVGVPPGVTRTTPGIGSVPYSAEVRLEIRDPKTNVLLWGFAEHPDQAMLQSNRDKNFDEALARIVAALQGLGAAAGAVPGQ